MRLQLQIYIPHSNTVAYSAPRSLDGKPTMPVLLCFETSSGKINIAQEIGNDYYQFGILLLNDDVGAITTTTASEYQRNAKEINQDIMRKWLQGKGKRPVTWSTLIDVLRNIQLSELAKTIENTVFAGLPPNIHSKDKQVKGVDPASIRAYATDDIINANIMEKIPYIHHQYTGAVIPQPLLFNTNNNDCGNQVKKRLTLYSY